MDEPKNAWATKANPAIPISNQQRPEQKQREVEKGFFSGAEVLASDVSITGLRIVFNSRLHWFRRITWTVVLIVCTALTFLQVLDRIQNFEDKPITVRVRIMRNESLPFPYITVCPFVSCDRHQLSPTKIRSLWAKVFPGRQFPSGNRTILQEIGYTGTEKSLFGITRWGDNFEKFDCDMTDEQKKTWVKEKQQFLAAAALLAAVIGPTKLWNETSYVEENRIFESCYLGRGLECDTRGSFHQTMTINGKCMTYKPDRVTLGGMYHGLYLRFNSSTHHASHAAAPFGWSVLLHGGNQPPQTAAFTHGYYVEGKLMEKDIAATLRTFKAKNTPKKPCEEIPQPEHHFCAVNCYETALTQMTQCRLPFMRTREFPECNTSISYVKATVLAMDILEGVRNGSNSTWDFEKDCDCPQPCYRELYEMQSDTGAYDIPDRSLLRVYFPDLSFEEISEEMNYGVIPLLCDFGGSLGLLLGASVLTVVEIIEVAMAKLTSAIKTSKKTSETPETNNIVVKHVQQMEKIQSLATRTPIEDGSNPHFVA